MSIADVVVHLTERLMPYARPELHPVLHVIATMPQWVAKQDLTQWEEQCNTALEKVWPARGSYTERLRDVDPHLFLTDGIYELGIHNLYGAYQEKSTKRAYQRILEFFREQNISGEKAVAEVDLSGW